MITPWYGVLSKHWWLCNGAQLWYYKKLWRIITSNNRTYYKYFGLVCSNKCHSYTKSNLRICPILHTGIKQHFFEMQCYGRFDLVRVNSKVVPQNLHELERNCLNNWIFDGLLKTLKKKISIFWRKNCSVFKLFHLSLNLHLYRDKCFRKY